MKPNGYQTFQVVRTGLVACDNKAITPTLEEAEANIKIPRDYMGDLTFVVLPIYTNKRPTANNRPTPPDA